MSTWILGDVHGCFRTFRSLLNRCEFNDDLDRLILVGDLVNGGPDSLDVLRWIYQHRDNVESVLGNHDLYLLARWSQAVGKKKRDTLDPLLNAPDRGRLLDWLLRRPLTLSEKDFRVVHAGLLPDWSWQEAVARGRAIEQSLQNDDLKTFLTAYYERKRDRPEQRSSEMDRLYGSLQALTMIRTVSADGLICSEFSGSPEETPKGFRPWYEFSSKWQGPMIYFGHWAACGFRRTKNAVALDSGCVWGDQLTAVRVEDGSVIQQESLEENHT